MRKAKYFKAAQSRLIQIGSRDIFLSINKEKKKKMEEKEEKRKYYLNK